MGIYLPKIFIFERILKFFSKKFGSLKNIRTFAIPNGKNAEIAQLVEHNLAKVGVASSSLVFRSLFKDARMVESVDTRDLKSLGHCGCAGSSPASSTKESQIANS